MYTGAITLIGCRRAVSGSSGAMSIRTARGHAFGSFHPGIQAGGGWVNDSTPEAEYDETVNKAKAMLKAVALAEQFNRPV